MEGERAEGAGRPLAGRAGVPSRADTYCELGLEDERRVLWNTRVPLLSPNSHVEALTPIVMVTGDGRGLGLDETMRGEPSEWE